MQKRLVIYSIAKEKVRLAFEAAIQGIDGNCVGLIDQHATVFHSSKTLKDLFGILTASGIECPPDEFWILTLDRPFTGHGVVLDDLKEFLLK